MWSAVFSLLHNSLLLIFHCLNLSVIIFFPFRKPPLSLHYTEQMFQLSLLPIPTSVPEGRTAYVLRMQRLPDGTIVRVLVINAVTGRAFAADGEGRLCYWS